MASDEQYRDALAALALEIGLDPQDLAAHEQLVMDGVCVQLALVRRLGGVAIRGACKIGPLPRQPSEALLRLLLQTNTLGEATGGTTVGLQNAADDLVLASAHPLDTPAQALARACRTLAQVAMAWRAALDNGWGQTSAATASSTASR